METPNIAGNDLAAAHALKIALAMQGQAALALIASLPQPQGAPASAPAQTPADPASRLGQNVDVMA